MKETKKKSLNLLANELIKELQKNKNPFDTDVVIFPNLLIEQWFKAYWIKNTKEVLMNVKFMRLHSFFAERFKTNKKVMPKSIMTTKIYDILSSEYQDYPEIKDYYEKEGQINQVNLYDLSSKLTSLFNTYEKKGVTLSGWQERLYKKIKVDDTFIYTSDLLSISPIDTTRVFVFGFKKLEDLDMKLLNKFSNIEIYTQEDIVCDKKITNLCEASSIEREVEYVHGKICEIFETDHNVKLSDIVVYAPDVSKYSYAIEKVFKEKEDSNFPNISYIVLDQNRNLSNTAEAISLIHYILHKGELTRTELYKLLSNPNIVKARGYEYKDIMNVINALDDMNVFRNHECCDEWDYALKRILLSKYIGDSYNMDNSIDLDDIYLPYGSIDLDDHQMILLCSMIEDMKSFMSSYETFKEHVDVDLLTKEFDKWLSYSKEGEAEANYYYKKALDVIDGIKENGYDLPIDVVISSMTDASLNITVTPNNVLNGGITFINFNESNILSAKYMFFMGMANNNLPKADIKDEISLYTPESNTTIAKRVLNALRNNAEFEYFSYVSLNLASLEEYSLTPILEDTLPSITLKLSENREYQELYSETEFNKKAYNTGLFNTTTEEKEVKEVVEICYNEKLKQKDLVEFIKEGLSGKLRRFFQIEDDDFENTTKSYEPLLFDSLTEYSIKKEMMALMLEKNTDTPSDEDLDKIYEKYKASHDAPYVLDIKAYFDNLITQIGENYNAILKPYMVVKPFELSLEFIKDNKNIHWTYMITDSFMLHQDGLELSFFENYFNLKSEEDSKYARIYMISLAYIASLKTNKEYQVTLNGVKAYQVTSKEAYDILNRLYLEYHNFDNLILTPLDKIKLPKDRDKVTYDDIFQTLKGQGGAWCYFAAKEMMNAKEVAGYDRYNFDEYWENYIKFVEENILYVKTVKEEAHE